MACSFVEAPYLFPVHLQVELDTKIGVLSFTGRDTDVNELFRSVVEYLSSKLPGSIAAVSLSAQFDASRQGKKGLGSSRNKKKQGANRSRGGGSLLCDPGSEFRLPRRERDEGGRRK